MIVLMANSHSLMNDTLWDVAEWNVKNYANHGRNAPCSDSRYWDRRLTEVLEVLNSFCHYHQRSANGQDSKV